MSIIAIIRLLLSLVRIVMRRASDKQQQQIGEDRAIKNNLVSILVQVKTGKRIDAESKRYTDDDIDRILSGHFRSDNGE